MEDDTFKRPPYGGESVPRRMDLKTATWMVRNLDQPVSMVHLTSENDVFAGGWDGQLTHWDGEGNHRWTTLTNDRISGIALNDTLVAVASGLHVVVLSRSSGDVVWSAALEGSADEVMWWQDDLVAVSSVYDIEHNDFIESAVWRFSSSGQLQWVERMDERPWTLIAADDRLLAGLGRPRCGHLDVSSSPPFEHTKPPTSSPTTCGTAGRAQGLFGQTDGTVVNHQGEVLSTEEGAVEHLTCMVKGYVATTDNGLATGRTEEGQPCWSSKGAPVSAQTEAMEHDGSSLLWLARDAGADSTVDVWATNKGGKLASGNFAKVRAMHGTSERMVLGCEDGSVMVWDREMFHRRLNTSVPTQDTDERTSALQAKLRALRGS
jgi:WD40 repeat protein